MSYAFSLTGLTGRKKNVDRTFIVATVEVNRFTSFVVAGALVISLFPSLLIGALLFSLWYWAFLIPPVCVVLALYFVDQRAKTGLQLRRYRSIREGRKHKKEEQVIYVCSRPLAEPVLGKLIPQFIDAAPAPAETVRGVTLRGRATKGNLFDE